LPDAHYRDAAAALVTSCRAVGLAGGRWRCADSSAWKAIAGIDNAAFCLGVLSAHQVLWPTQTLPAESGRLK
jgi:hypothetical protein